MTTTQILTTLRDALGADQALEAWCQEQFGKPATVLLGLDERNPPREEDYPVVAIVGITQLRGESRRELEWQVFLGAGVVNELIETSGNVRSAVGILQAETLRELAENAFYRARIGSAQTAGEASTISYYPLFVSYTAITLTALKSTQQGLP